MKSPDSSWRFRERQSKWPTIAVDTAWSEAESKPERGMSPLRNGYSNKKKAGVLSSLSKQ
ncbi:hypothetical protein PENCOP_c009G08068 [Penicillium coprophilum]|uniref:Uncharacterized protein n=1 Tax=Penicillium coprophilum TaxID=36646 RepID=A0A1V6UH46_9EURO|nr:hypothetical protein PENCOP_c009G08068 [Penicillium coprophilum]